MKVRTLDLHLKVCLDTIFFLIVTHFIVSSMFQIIYFIFRNSVSYKIKCTIIKNVLYLIEAYDQLTDAALNLYTTNNGAQ